MNKILVVKNKIIPFDNSDVIIDNNTIKFNNINRENKNDNIGNIHFFILDSAHEICIISKAIIIKTKYII